MIPIRDEIKTRIVPVVNYALIAANVLMFLYMLSMGSGVEAWVQRNALVPVNIRFRAGPGRPESAVDEHVHACRLDAPDWQYALPVDIWR